MLYSDFMRANSINHNDNIDTFSDGLKYLIESNSNIVSYDTQINLLLFNTAVLEVDKNGSYIYEYTLKKEADIIDNIHIISLNSNVKIIYIIGGEEYDNIKTFLSYAAQYHEFKLKFIFTDPKEDDKITICYRNFLLNPNLRKIIMNENTIKTDTNIYHYGMCTRL